MHPKPPARTSRLFRQRKFLPVPFAALVLGDVLCHGHPWHWGTYPRALLDGAALLLIAAGESLRVWGVGYIGRKSRSSDIHAARLVTSGPYAHTRNPLYFGGFLLTLGLCALTGSPAVVLGCLLYWCLVYGPIIRTEERFLHQAFGRHYAAYCRVVPRWWPQLFPGPGAHRASWHWQELSKEYQTAIAIVVTAVLVQASLWGGGWLRSYSASLALARSAPAPAVQRSPVVTASAGVLPTAASPTLTVSVVSTPALSVSARASQPASRAGTLSVPPHRPTGSRERRS